MQKSRDDKNSKIYIALLEAAVKALQEDDVKQTVSAILRAIRSDRSASHLEYPSHVSSSLLYFLQHTTSHPYLFNTNYSLPPPAAVCAQCFDGIDETSFD